MENLTMEDLTKLLAHWDKQKADLFSKSNGSEGAIKYFYLIFRRIVQELAENDSAEIIPPKIHKQINEEFILCIYSKYKKFQLKQIASMANLARVAFEDAILIARPLNCMPFIENASNLIH